MKILNINHLTTSFLIISCILMNSCNKGPSEDTSSAIVVDIDKKESGLTFSDLFSDYRIIPLEKTSSSIIGDITDIQIYNDTMYILDATYSKALYLFDKEGRFLTKISRLGKGPGEYLIPQSFDIEDNRVRLLCSLPSRLIFYSKEGEYIEDYPLPSQARDFASYNNRYYFSLLLGTQNVKNPAHLLAQDINGRRGKYYFKSSEYHKDILLNIRIGPKLFFKYDNLIRYSMPFCSTIYSISENRIIPYLILSTHNGYNSIYEIIDDKKVSGDFRMDLIREGKLHFISHYGENDQVIYCDFFQDSKYSMIYFKNKQMAYVGKIKDNLTLINPEIIGIYKNTMTGIISSHKRAYNRLIESAKEDRLNVSPEEKLRLQSITEDDNPIIILYEFKDKL